MNGEFDPRSVDCVEFQSYAQRQFWWQVYEFYEREEDATDHLYPQRLDASFFKTKPNWKIGLR